MSIFRLSSVSYNVFLFGAGLLILMGCTGVDCPKLPQRARQLVHVVYFGSGPAPVGADLIVEEGGGLRLTSLRNREFCSAGPALAHDVARSLKSKDVIDALSEIKRCPESFMVNDAERVVFSLSGEDFEVATARMPSELLPLLRELDQGFSQKFGRRRYGVPLVPQGKARSAKEIASCP